MHRVTICWVFWSRSAMADQFADSANNVVIEEVNKGLNPGMIVLIVVATFLLLFFVGNYALYVYAQKTLPPRKKKPVSKKKMKREKLKQGVSAPGDSATASLGIHRSDRPPHISPSPPTPARVIANNFPTFHGELTATPRPAQLVSSKPRLAGAVSPSLPPPN
uniref:Uncharacterized protein n=2 Tax=Oryza meridionalis TaxID=40149 RepID=A0A0E0DDS4_9ORYZ